MSENIYRVCAHREHSHSAELCIREPHRLWECIGVRRARNCGRYFGPALDLDFSFRADKTSALLQTHMMFLDLQ